MKFAFDVHGVLDTHEEYRALMRSLYDLGHVIYIISGQAFDEEMTALLYNHDLLDWHHHYIGVETYLLETQPESWEERDGGKFWSDALWDPVKSVICHDEDIDMIWDDSPTYAEHFKGVRTHYNLVIDKTKKLTDGRAHPRKKI
jgi:hypothetical protein